MNDSRYKLLAIAATVSVASSLAATAAAEPEKDVSSSIARPVLLAENKDSSEPLGHSTKNKATPSPKGLSSSDKDLSPSIKSAPQNSDGGARAKSDKR